MAEQRKKTHSLLLSVDGKNVSVELFDAALWPHQSSKEGLFRVRINGVWYSPAGKYTFLPFAAVGVLVANLLAGEEPLQYEDPPVMKNRQRVTAKVLYADPPAFDTPPPDLKENESVSARFGECIEGLPLRIERGWTTAPPFRGVDGQWYVHVALYGGVKAIPFIDVELRR